MQALNVNYPRAVFFGAGLAYYFFRHYFSPADTPSAQSADLGLYSYIAIAYFVHKHFERLNLAHLNVITRTTSQRQHFHLLLFFYAPARTRTRTRVGARTRNLKRALTPAQLSPHCPTSTCHPSASHTEKSHIVSSAVFPFWCFLFSAFHFFHHAFPACVCALVPVAVRQCGMRQLGNSQLGNSGPITRHLLCAPPVECCCHKNCFACFSVQSLSATLEVLALSSTKRRFLGGVASWLSVLLGRMSRPV